MFWGRLYTVWGTSNKKTYYKQNVYNESWFCADALKVIFKINGLTINIWKVCSLQHTHKKKCSTQTELSKKKFNYRDLFLHDWLSDILFMEC